MSNVVDLLSGHGLIGTWCASDEGSSVEYTVRAVAKGFAVEAVDRDDGEVLQISDVLWDGQTLSFETLVPSNGYRARHALRVNPDGTLRDDFQAFYSSTLSKK